MSQDLEFTYDEKTGIAVYPKGATGHIASQGYVITQSSSDYLEAQIQIRNAIEHWFEIHRPDVNFTTVEFIFSKLYPSPHKEGSPFMMDGITAKAFEQVKLGMKYDQ